MPFSRSRSPESMHPVDDRLVGAEGARLAEHRVDERGLAVVDVGDDGEVPQVARGRRRRRGVRVSGRDSSWATDCRTDGRADTHPAMTVAAVILAAAPSRRSPMRRASAGRRIAEAAWAGGAMPIVVVSFDPDGAVAASLAGASVTLAEPVPKPEGAPARQMARGIDVAGRWSTTSAAHSSGRRGWSGSSPETVTSLIEAHGVDRVTMLRPAYEGEAGWPVLLPRGRASILASVAPDRMPDDILADLVSAGVATRAVDVGDPGVTHDARVPRDQLPAYLGPTEPGAPHSHEWGAALADAGEDSPIEGPGLAPYEQAATE